MNQEIYDKFNAINAALGRNIYGPQIVIRMRHEAEHPKLPRFWCTFEGVEVKGDGVLIGTYGNGSNPIEAMEDYLSKIRNKTLVYKATSEDRKEVTIL